MRQERGFTLVELIITVAIIAIVMSYAVPAYSRFVAQNKVQSLRGDTPWLRCQRVCGVFQHGYQLWSCHRLEQELDYHRTGWRGQWHRVEGASGRGGG